MPAAAESGSVIPRLTTGKKRAVKNDALIGVLALAFGGLIAAWWMLNPGDGKSVEDGLKEASAHEREAPEPAEKPRRQPVEGPDLERSPSVEPTIPVAELVAVEPTPTEAPVAKISGRLVDPLSRAIGGALVSWRARNESITTDTAGRFLLELATRSDRNRTFRLQITHPGFGARVVDVDAKGGESVELGDLILETGGALSGRVVDRDGASLSGATVQIQEATRHIDGSRFHGAQDVLLEIETDDRGEFRISGVPATMVCVWAGAEGRIWEHSPVVQVQPAEEVGDLVLELRPLEPEDSIEFLVIDPEGKPVPHAPIQFRYATKGRSGSGGGNTDGDGRYRRLVDVRAPYSFEVFDPDHNYRPAVAREVAPGTHDLVLQLTEYRAFQLRVRDEDGEPLVGFEAEARDLEAGNTRLSSTDAEGSFEDGIAEIPLPTLPFELWITAEGYERIKLGPFQPERMPETVDAVLLALPGVRGHVSAEGSIAEGAEVTLHRVVEANQRYVVDEFQSRSEHSAAGRGTTEADGGFNLSLRDDGSYYVRVEMQGYAPTEVGPFDVQAGVGLDDLLLELTPGGVIEGRVSVPSGDTPADRIVGISRGDGFGRTVRTDREGSYRFDGLTPGPWLVKLREEEIHSGSRTTTMTMTMTDEPAPLPFNCDVFEATVTRFDLAGELRRPAELHGRLSLGDDPLGGWTALIRPAGSPDNAGARTYLDSEGRFYLAVPGSGSYHVELTGKIAGGATGWLYQDLELVAGDNDFAHTLQTGSVVGQAGFALGDQSLSVAYTWWNDSGLRFHTRSETNADGSFEFPRVPVGSGQLNYFLAEDDSESVEVTVQSGKTAHVELSAIQ